MSRSPARYIMILVAVAACNRDEKAATPDAGASTPAVTKTPAGPARASGATNAPAPSGSATRPAPDPDAAATAQLASAAQVRTVQVAAFPSPATANWWVAELKRQGIPAYTSKATTDGKEVTRLRIGIATTAAEARALANKIQARYHWPVWIATVEDKSVVTGAMLNASRRYAGS